MAKEMFCTSCHITGKTRNEIKGSFIVELAMWLLFILPGIIYSVWRLSTKAKVCRSCGSKELIAPESPKAREFKNESGIKRHDPTPTDPSGLIACPDCAEPIRAAAKKCRFCGCILEGKVVGQAEKEKWQPESKYYIGTVISIGSEDEISLEITDDSGKVSCIGKCTETCGVVKPGDQVKVWPAPWPRQEFLITDVHIRAPDKAV